MKKIFLKLQNNCYNKTEIRILKVIINKFKSKNKFF